MYFGLKELIDNPNNDTLSLTNAIYHWNMTEIGIGVAGREKRAPFQYTFLVENWSSIP